MESMKTVRSFIIAVTIALCAAGAAASQESGSGSVQVASTQNRSVGAADPGQSKAQRDQLYRELARIENDYMKVVKYYNSRLTNAQALQIARFVLYYSVEFKLDPRLVMAVIVVESRFKPRAVSPKGAMGLGQLMPGTARMMGVKNPYDTKQNIYGTTRYLRQQYDRWSTSDQVLDLMLASYNAGPEAVKRHKGVPPYKETKKYVRDVKTLYRFFIYGH